MAQHSKVNTKSQLREWEQGVQAFHDGLSRRDCPYRLIALSAYAVSDEGRKRDDWLGGFNFARSSNQA